MDLASMLEREDFFPLFFDTIKKYYNEVYGQNVDIDFADKKDCNLVIKPFLSAATAPHMSSNARSFFYSEWNVRNSILKYLAAKVGVAIFTHSGKMFSKFTFRVTPETTVTSDLVIAPNNRSIRFFDYRSQTVGCMIKCGFTRKYFQNQLEFRKSNSYSFMLPMLKWGEDWFVEPIMKGHPLARITDNKLYERSVKKAVDNLAILAADTLQYIPSAEYLAALDEKIQRLLVRASTEKNIKTAAQTAAIAAEALKWCRNDKQPIPTVMSHGDFQSGNIWVDDDGKVWLYDWETAERRSAWYDASVLSYSLRRFTGWDTLMHTENPEWMQMCIPNQPKEWDYEAMKAVVLLEDLVFYLEDMLELPQKWGAELYDAYIQRLMKIEDIWRIEK